MKWSLMVHQFSTLTRYIIILNKPRTLVVKKRASRGMSCKSELNFALSRDGKGFFHEGLK